MISLVWAEDSKGAIGKNGTLPWRLPNDMKFFKDTTMGHNVLMRRKTFESMNKRPLPGRNNIVLTRQKDYEASGATVIHDAEELKSLVGMDETLYIIGGSEIYQIFLPSADELWRTKIEGDFDGDTFFPSVEWNEWTLAEEIDGIQDEKNLHAHVFQRFERNK